VGVGHKVTVGMVCWVVCTVDKFLWCMGGPGHGQKIGMKEDQDVRTFVPPKWNTDGGSYSYTVEELHVQLPGGKTASMDVLVFEGIGPAEAGLKLFEFLGFEVS